MSKRHQKFKNFQIASGDDYEDGLMMADNFAVFQAPKGKKLKGRDRRKSIKRAFYDD